MWIFPSLFHSDPFFLRIFERVVMRLSCLLFWATMSAFHKPEMERIKIRVQSKRFILTYIYYMYAFLEKQLLCWDLENCHSIKEVYKDEAIVEKIKTPGGLSFYWIYDGGSRIAPKLKITFTCHTCHMLGLKIPVTRLTDLLLCAKKNCNKLANISFFNFC